MEAFGEDAANWSAARAADQAVTPGFTAAPLLRSSGLRSAHSSTLSRDPEASDRGAAVDLRCCLEAVETAVASAPAALALAGFGEAADYAELTEELSREVEHLQLLAAAAVDRSRTAALRAASSASKAAGWTTGWRTESIPASGSEPGTAAVTGAAVTEVSRAEAADPADDGCRNSAEFLRVRLRISAGEARRRLALASAVLPGNGVTGEPLPAPCAETGAALAAGTIAARAGTIITTALGKARPIASPETLADMEEALLHTAAESDHDVLARVAYHWIGAIDQDGTEPTEEELRRRQGAFLRRPRRGLHHVEIFATTDQYEHLLTVMNTATNPRTQPSTEPTPAPGPEPGPGPGTEPHTGTGFSPAAETAADNAHLERRTRPQQLLDGLVGACKAALTTNTLPATGGLRPQIMVTINYQDLLTRLHTAAECGGGTTGSGAGNLAGTGRGTEGWTRTGKRNFADPGAGSGTLAFSGAVTASTVRKIACDADIIPVLLGGEGRILDIGRATRIFPAHIRKALTARDQGCAFPNCTIPAPWCEAHHTTYWSHGGPTSTDNGVLLCTHHHHLIHKEQWQIAVTNGIPWFIPPPHIDPRQKPRRNHPHRT